MTLPETLDPIVAHHHPARVACQAPGRFRGNVAPLLQHGLAWPLRVRQDGGVHMDHHYWSPFLWRQGSAPTYLASVSDEGRERIRSLLESRLAPTPGRPIELTARAWADRGIV